MANLLPKDFQKHLRRVERARLMLALGLAVTAAALMLFAALLPASIALYYASRVGSAAESRAPALAQADVAALQEVRGMVFALKPIVVATTTPTQAILQALSAKPPSVSIDHITYTAGTPGTVLLAGDALSPGALNAYRAALASDTHFSSVTVPVSALIGADNGRFTMTIKGNF